MTRYVVRVYAENYDHTIGAIDPADLDSVRALWSALPADLRLALAKTAPKVAGPRIQLPSVRPGSRGTGRLVINAFVPNCYCGHAKSSAEAQQKDAELIRQGYVLEEETP